MVAEVTTFVAFLKAFGVDTGRLIESLFIVMIVLSAVLYWISKKAWPHIKKFLETMDDVKVSIKDLNSTLQEHIIQTDLRLQEGTENFEALRSDIDKLNKRLSKLETKGE